MNTEQLKTDDSFEDKYINPIVDSILLYHSRQPIKRLSDFASQESKIAVSEFKEKLKDKINDSALTHQEKLYFKHLIDS